MTQGERIKDVRNSLGLTLEKFGEKLGAVSYTHLTLPTNSRV